MRAHGLSARRISRTLDARHIPCPSAHDPRRNTHRTGLHWTAGTVLAILDNPRYLGHQVWGRQHRYDDLIDVDNLALGSAPRRQKTEIGRWTWSLHPAQPALIDITLWQRAHSARAARTPRKSERTYHLSGLLTCAHCGHRMQGGWNNGKAVYRCKHDPERFALAPNTPRTICVKEESILPHLPAPLIRLGLWMSYNPPDDDTHAIDAAETLRHNGIQVAYDHLKRTISSGRNGEVRIGLDSKRQPVSTQVTG